MARPPQARERALDAFEKLLNDDGVRAATLDATAHAAGISKGGLLYHFAGREALEDGLIGRLRALVDVDVATITAAGDEAVAHYVRTSVSQGQDLDRAMLAVSRLAQAGHTAAAAALTDMRGHWANALRPHVRDEAALDLVMLVSDGLYFNSLLEPAATSVMPSEGALEAMILRLTELIR